MIETLNIKQIQFDGRIYPRAIGAEGFYQNVGRITTAMKQGKQLPPIIAGDIEGRDGYWLIDGEHRVLATKKLGRKTIAVEIRKYSSVEEAFRDAVQLNSVHGLQYSLSDLALILEKGRNFGIPDNTLAHDMNYSTKGFGLLTLMVQTDKKGKTVILKAAVARQIQQQMLSEKDIKRIAFTEDQSSINVASSTSALRQVVYFFRNDMIPIHNEEVSELCLELRELLENYVPKLEAV